MRYFEFVLKINSEQINEKAGIAERVAQLDESKPTTKLVTTIEERDIPESDVNKQHKKKQIGFYIA